MKRVSVVVAALALAACGTTPPASDDGGIPAPDQPVRLVFIHHSTGENWLRDDDGALAIALASNGYFVSDTNYGWGPTDPELGGPIGDYTDIGHWWNWFLGPSSDTTMDAVYTESGQTFEYSRLSDDPGGPNEVVMFKSCFPNSEMGGNPDDPPTTGRNPLEGAGLENLTVGNAKGLYLDLLDYFGAHPDTLFVVITAPPLQASDTSPEAAANARAFNTWLATDWLADYPYPNVAVFDFYNVLTAPGNHHRVVNGQIEYVTDTTSNASAYPSGDSHPNSAGNQKATLESLPMLNLFYQRWQDGK
jgi:hypothetical protein